MKIFSTHQLLLIPLLFSLSSCFVARNYQRPEVIHEDQYRTDRLSYDTLSTGDTTQDSTTLAQVPWQEMFTDPYLQEYIELGLKNNIDIRVALQQIAAAQAYAKQGQAAFFPTLEANPQVTHQELSRNSQFGEFFDGGITQYSLTAGLAWEADIWGKIRSQKRAFQARYLQTVAAHQAVKTDLIANIASTYYRLLSLDEQRRITLETIENRKNSLKTTEALKIAGTVTEVGVKQTEAQIYVAQALLVDIKLNIKLAENALSILLNETPQPIERSRLDEQEISQELEVGFPVQLLRHRPDVLAAEYGLVNAFELTNVARSQFYPSVVISATGGFQSLELSQLLNPNSLFANLAGGLTQPIFQGRRIRTQYEVAETDQEQAYLDFRQAVLTATREVSDALYSFEAAEESIDINLQQFQAYDTAVVYSEKLLDNGLANYLEVLTAQENTLNAQINVINARFNRLDAVVELYRALGGGWR